MSFNILASPLQGFTDFKFRNTVDKVFGGVDTYYAPYIRLQGQYEIKNAYKRDLLPANNSVKQLVPQVMTNCAKEFLFVAAYVQSLGYNELNWNLGCPYPMVSKRGLGSGLLKQAGKIDEILKKVSNESEMDISLKLRLGYEHSHEILDLLPVLEKHKIKSMVIHPRLGKQLYKGEVNLELFQQCIENTSHRVIYNGDINSVEKFSEMKQRFPSITGWALGRGLIANPFLAEMIKTNSTSLPENWTESFGSFHDTLFQYYAETLSGPGHIIMKMQSFWEYFSQLFSNPHKAHKSIKKAKSIAAYHEAVRVNMKGERS